VIQAKYVSLLAFFPGVLFGQPAAATSAPPSFEVAGVHKSAHVIQPHMRGGVPGAGRFEVRTASMLDLISYAWTIRAEKLWGGPPWLDFDRFDISAKAPANTPPETVRLMLRTLLTERFGLKVHEDTKPMQVYVLSGKGGKPGMKEADGSKASGCQNETAKPDDDGVAYSTVKCYGRNLDQIAQDLRNIGFGYLSNPVVNQTGIGGAWDFTLRWASRTSGGAAGSHGITLFEAVDKQLGLKLEAARVPVPVLAIDSLNEAPTPDPPGVSSALPPPPSEFETAVVKPSNPDSGQPSSRLEHGRLSARNVTLKQLIAAAWDNLPDELLVNAPKFLDTAHYDITAVGPAPAPGAEADEDDVRRMLRALLAERFKLQTHMEDRPVEGYVLSSLKPRMAKADPSNRTGCHEGPGPDGNDPRIKNPVLGRLVTCQNMTMAQFAQELPRLAGAYARVDVLDETLLTDAYDFTLSFSNLGQFRGGEAVQSALVGNEAATDPNGAVSLPEAVRRQLGLRIELRKHPMQVLVIDHVEEKPGGN
jgi:uncharacterized protein (TIGR03435 family)